MATTPVYNKSVWSIHSEEKLFPHQSIGLEVDVAIIGGGITGISTAYALSKAGKSVGVFEAKKIGMGTTGTSTGNLYATIDEQLHTIKSKHNEEVLNQVVASRIAAINFIEERVKEFNIACEFQRVPFYLFTTEETKVKNAQIRNEREAAQKAGLQVFDTVPPGFPFNYDEIASIYNQAQFNPLKYVRQLATAIAGSKCRIYEDTKVTHVEDGKPCIVHTERGQVKARHVVMATHSPKGIYAVHTAMEPYREFAIAVKLNEPAPQPGIYWHKQLTQHYSMRPYIVDGNEYLIVLGEAYKVGHQTHSEDNIQKILDFINLNFKVASVEYIWAAQNYKPADNLPFIGTPLLQNFTYIATGFAADGLVYGTLSGMIIRDSILGIDNPWAKIYDPKRFTPAASAPKFIKANADVAAQLLKDYLFYGDVKEVQEIKAGEGKTIKLNNERLAAYRDENSQLHIVSAICPHMGCVVHWNNGEKSWDCPCHGSRFSIDGEVLEGPAYHSLAKPKDKH